MSWKLIRVASCVRISELFLYPEFVCWVVPLTSIQGTVSALPSGGLASPAAGVGPQCQVEGSRGWGDSGARGQPGGGPAGQGPARCLTDASRVPEAGLGSAP